MIAYESHEAAQPQPIGGVGFSSTEDTEKHGKDLEMEDSFRVVPCLPWTKILSEKT